MVRSMPQKADKWEYGIKHHSDSIFDEDQHRTGMTLPEALQWIKEWREEGGTHEAFTIVRRPTGNWEEVL